LGADCHLGILRRQATIKGAKVDKRGKALEAT